ncbi:MAG TPA: UDP-2,3-diacylglucosamine diphosphatase LpxI, partial [Afifellaceae bacterium]|nr:UDP-2,3-diacylglucosamine diphosphatase LpxI [Afifellaceae bacterium]
GVTLVGPLAVAPELALPEGLVAGSDPSTDLRADLARAAKAARAIGKLDIGQAAVAVDGRVVALEGAEGTDGLLERVTRLRDTGRIAKTGGVLVKCMKPTQDPRLDLPGIGPKTAAAVRRAGLDGVAGDAGRALLVGRAETIAAFEDEGLFLVGLPPPRDEAGGGND